MRRSLAAIIAVSLSITAISVRAQANGRFPEAQTIESPAGDGTTLFLRTTFGILVSRDAGKRWRWICERALGYEGQWDPPIAVTRDGTLWVGLEGGLLSTKDGCVAASIPELDGETVKDLTVDPTGETLWAITGAAGKPSFVWRRAPGKRFEKLAAMGETNLMTIEVAPNHPSRVYVSGQPYTTIRGQLFRSDDGGKTFTTKKNELEADGPFFIGAIDPKDPGRLLVRHLHAKGSDLLLTRDGGKSWKNVLPLTSAMYGFAKSEDGATYWAGSGLPEHGIYRSTDRGEHFEPIGKHGVLCLHAAAGGRLFVCQNAFEPGASAVGLSLDEGKTVQSLARFADIEGPVGCDAPDARASLCASAWPETRALFVPPEAGVPDAGPKRKRSEADGGAAPPSAPRSTCGCHLLGSRGSTTDRTFPIEGLITLVMWGCACIRRGSKHPQRVRQPSARRRAPRTLTTDLCRRSSSSRCRSRVADVRIVSSSRAR